MSFEAAFSRRAFPRAGADAAGTAGLYVMLAAALNLVFLELLVLVAVGALQRREREVPLELTAVAEGTAPMHISPNEVIVHVGPGGEIVVSGRPVGIEWLEERLGRLVEEVGDTAVTVRADVRAPFELVVRILAACRKAGVRDAALVTVAPPG